MDLTSLQEFLQKHGQEHLLHHWDSLSEEQRSAMLKSLGEIDWARINTSFERSVSSSGQGGKLDDRMSPLSPEQCASVKDTPKETQEEYQKIGYEAMKEGQLAILLVAGGSGTRLGVSYPKGMYSVGLESDKSLFQLQAERLLKLEMLSEGEIP
ncbi:UDP-N-acetylhexosamine pyrophosphorylase, partial [Caligus rogercresseyi]